MVTSLCALMYRLNVNNRGRNFGVKSGGTNSGERGALWSWDERKMERRYLIWLWDLHMSDSLTIVDVLLIFLCIVWIHCNIWYCVGTRSAAVSSRQWALLWQRTLSQSRSWNHVLMNSRKWVNTCYELVTTLPSHGLCSRNPRLGSVVID